MSFVNFKNAINTKLGTITQLKSVVSYPSKDFSGYPAAVVVPSDQDSIYETNKENQRTYC